MVVMTRFKGSFVDVLLVPINPPPSVARDISRAFKALASCPPASLKVSLRRPRRAQGRRRAPAAGAMQQQQQQQLLQSPVSSTSSQKAFPAATTPPPLPAASSPAADAARSGSPVVLPSGGAAGGSCSWKEGLRDLVRDQHGRDIMGDEEEYDEDDIDGDAETYGYPSSLSWNGGVKSNSTNSRSSVRSRRHAATTVPPPEGIPVTDRPRHAMAKHRQAVLALAVDGKRVFAGSQDGLITLYELRDFRCVCTLAGHSQTIFSLSVHHDRLYSSSTRVVKIWDTNTFRLLSTLRYSDGDVFALALGLGRSVAGPAGTSIVRCTRAPAVAASSAATAVASGVGAGIGARGSEGRDSGSEMESGATTVGSGGHVVRIGFGDSSQSLSPKAHLYSFLEGDRSGGVATGSFRGSAVKFGGSFVGVVGEGGEEEKGEVKYQMNGGAVVGGAGGAEGAGGGPGAGPGVGGAEVGGGAGAGAGDAGGGGGVRVLRNSMESDRGEDGGGVGTVCHSTEAALVLTDSNKNGHCSRVYALAVAHQLICSGAGDTFVKVGAGPPSSRWVLGCFLFIMPIIMPSHPIHPASSTPPPPH
ncbi:unnamed protein product [Closterium sp. Yama58-4]|nr:unnamed protein product [Closterium sp. Yama58-4]